MLVYTNVFFLSFSPKIWIGTIKGNILVKSPGNWEKDEALLNPYQGPATVSNLICMFIVTSASRGLCRYAWTYNYIGKCVSNDF